MLERQTFEREIALLLGRGAPPARAVAGSGIEHETPTAEDRAIFDVIATRIADDQAATRGANRAELEKMQALADALLAEDKERSRRATKELLDQLEKGKGLPTPTEEALEDVALELVARCYVLGLDQEREKLRAYFLARGYAFRARSADDRKAWALRGIIAHVARRRSLDLMARVFADLTRGVEYKGPNAWESELDPLFEAMFRALQALIESVAKELIARASTRAATLAEARTTIQSLRAAVLPRYRALPLQWPVTKTDFDEPERHVDYFDPEHGPSIPIRSYSRENETFSDKSLRVDRIFEIRVEQLDALETLYDRAAALKVKLDLHDDESWRAFALAAFDAAKASGKSAADALAETVTLLGTYLRGFTLHTPMNIDDFERLSVAKAMKESYLERKFPRAATGQRIHDCGVYALRIAYALSGVRERVGFSERAILFPAHVGLVITVGKVEKKEDLRTAKVIITHNDLVEDVKDVADAAAAWTERGRKYDADRFLAALSASRYFEDVPMPFRFEPIPALPTSTPGKTRRATLWKVYLTKLTARATPRVLDVLRSTSTNTEPWLEYLDVLELERRVNDEGLVLFWKDALTLWREHDHERRLGLAKNVLQGTAPDRVAKFRTMVGPMWKDYWRLSQTWREAMEALADKRARMKSFITDDPKLLERGAQVTEGEDALSSVSKYEERFWIYMGAFPSKEERLEKDPARACARALAIGSSTLLTGSDVIAPWSVYAPPEPMD